MEECTENKETEEEDNENLFLAFCYVDLHKTFLFQQIVF